MFNNGCDCSSIREYEIEFLWCFLTQNLIYAMFRKKQKPVENGASNNEKLVLCSQVLLKAMQNYWLNYLLFFLHEGMQNLILVMFLGPKFNSCRVLRKTKAFIEFGELQLKKYCLLFKYWLEGIIFDLQ